MSRWTVTELRGLRRSLKASLTHLSRAIDSRTHQRDELEQLRVRLRKDLAEVRRALKAEQEQVHENQEGQHAGQ